MHASMKRRLRLLAILMILCLLPLGAIAGAESGLGMPPNEQTGTMTASCTITMPEGASDKAYRITDALVETYQILPASSQLVIELPDAAQGAYLKWYLPPESYVFEQYDASGTLVSTDAVQPFYNCYYPLAESTRRIQMSFDKEASLSGVYIYGAADPLPASVQLWTARPEKVDMMFIAATPETAFDEFGTALAAYTAEYGVATAMTVMSDATRTSVEEFLDALWQMGVTVHPDFAQFHCDNNAVYKTVNAQWRKRTVTKYLTAAINACTPAVVVTHAESDALAAAQFTAEQVRSVAMNCGVSKLYMAGEGGQTALPETALIDGRTPAQKVADVYRDCCASRLQFVPELTPNTAYTLAETAVGQDTSGTDLLENIDKASMVNYVEPTPAPTATPEPTAEPTATPEPTAEPTPEVVPEETSKGVLGGYTVPLGVLAKILPTMGVGVVLTILTLLIFHDRIYRKYRRRRRRRKGKRVALWVGLAPVLVATVLSLVFLVLGVQKVDRGASSNQPLPEATAQPEPEPVPEQAEETPLEGEALAEGEAILPEGETPAEDASEGENASGERAPSDADQYFRTASDPAEVILSDYDAGRWEYKTDTLSILIDRRETTNAKGPVVYFVAHIRMRDVNSFRTMLSDSDNKGEGLQKPWIVSRRNKAVLLITGDNLVHMDTEYKSILIRQGRVYQDEYGKATDTMAMYPDMTMKIYERRTTTATELLEDGVREAFSFGPTLVRDGEVQTDVDVGRLRQINPRTGIGLVEPGHFVAIICDGRQAEYSVGMLLSEFAELFKQENCVQAYNLDGGVSTCMVFMGEQVNHHGVRKVNKRADDTYQRRIPDALIWGYSEQVPLESDPVTHTGELPG